MTEPLERLKAVFADRYRLERELGAGGMATVYLAEDLKHHREVAVKLLHPELAASLGAERFLREIDVTAHLQHPHILPLYDSGQADGYLFYVMPYVPGDSLRHRLQKERQLPLGDAVRIARGVAAALGYAHQRGIVHRDIKPENILLVSGEPVVADFGIARAIAAAGGGALTSTGLTIGTLSYMSPEQTAAERLDGRSDLYSLGCVLYEMLAGDAPFTGATAQVILARKLSEPVPSLRVVRASVPAEVEALVTRALAVAPADRQQTAEELIGALDRAVSGVGDALRGEGRDALPIPGTPSIMRGWRLPIAGFSLGIALGVGAAWLAMRQRPERTPDIATARFAIDLPSDAPVRPNELANVALSDDGTMLAYVAETPIGPRLYLRRLADTGFVEVQGGAHGVGPFFSPDARSLGFFAQGKLRKVALEGVAPVDLADAPLPRGAVWTTRGTILFTAAPGNGIWSVPDTGGRLAVVTRLDSLRGERTHRFAVPDRDGGVIATARTGGQPSFNQAEIVAFSAAGAGRRELVSGGSQARLLAGNILLFVRANTIYGVRLSPDHQARVGDPVALVDNVMTDPSTGAAQYAVSGAGTLVYVSGAEWRPRRSVVRMAGTAARPLLSDERAFSTARVSPDGRRVAVVVEDANDDIWLYDVASGGSRRLTFEAGSHIAPAWSPDGTTLAYSSNVAGHYNVYTRRADGTGSPRRVASSEYLQFPSGWSPDGKALAFTSSSIATGYDIWVADPITASSRPFLSSTFNEHGAVFSPDGKWVAYVSDETGQEEVYVRSFPDGAGQIQVSAAGGTNPHWTNAGRLYFRRREDLLSVDVVDGRVVPSSERVVASDAVGPGRITPVPGFDIHPQGGLIIVAENRRALPTRLQVVTGWLREVERHLPRP